MLDEFPTLEAALAISIIVLAWRLGLLLRALRAPSRHGGEPHRSSRRFARARGRAGTDLVIATVLAGALVYAQAASFAVRPAFYALGLTALILLLASAVVNARIATLSRVQLSHVKAVAATVEHAHASAGERERTATAPRVGPSCPACGSNHLAPLSNADELAKKLTAIGIESSALCTDCGHVEGRARAGTW